MTITQAIRHPFIKNLGWMSGAQLLNKILRLASTVIIARLLLPEEYGLIAIIFTVHDIVAVVVSRGTQTQIVNAPDDQLSSVCQNAYRFNWLVCIFATLCQMIAALITSSIFQRPELLAPIMVLACIHAFLPFAMVQASLNIRKGWLSLVAKIDVSQTFLETLCCITLLMFNFGIWALIIPRLIVLPIWILVHRHYSKWDFQRLMHTTRNHYTEASQHSPQHQPSTHIDSIRVLLTDLVVVLKNNIDYLIVGYFWGVEVLGIYFFAYNAGLGITTTLVNAAGSALFPHLCRHHIDGKLKHEFWFALKVLMSFTIVIVTLQVTTINYYIPIIFGERWVNLGAIPIIAILCLSAIPRAVMELFGQLLRSQHLLRLDFKVNLLFTSVLSAAIFFAVPYGSVYIASAITITSFGFASLAGVWVYRTVFTPTLVAHIKEYN